MTTKSFSEERVDCSAQDEPIPPTAREPAARAAIHPATPGPQTATTVSETSVGPQEDVEGEARAHVIIGPVGAGKSTFATALARQRRALRLTLDEWMARLFLPDRPDTGTLPWYVARTERCIDLMCELAEALILAGTPVVLEIGLLQRRERERFYDRMMAAAVPLTVYVLDAPRDVRRQRVEKRNRSRGATFSMVVPPAIFELASDLWEPPGELECQRVAIRFVNR